MNSWENEVNSLNQSPELTDVLLYNGFFHHFKHNDGFEMLKLLKTKKIDSNVIHENGVYNIFDLLDSKLSSNKTFRAIFNDLNNINGKGVGKSEHLMRLLFAGYDNTRTDCDGTLNGNPIEIKSLQSGCSFKPIKTGTTKIGLVDDLNEKYYNVEKTDKPIVLFDKMKLGTKSTLHSYFSELYPTKDVTVMIDNLSPLSDRVSFSDIISTQHLKWYKENDGWDSIVFLHPESRTLIVLHDLTEVTSLIDYGLKSKVSLKRCKDTQAVSDGYSVVSYKKENK
jgi:hypothetical protein